MTDTRLIHGFHAITAKLRHAADDVKEITVAEGRQDGRMRDLLKLAEAHGVRVILSDAKRLDGLAGGTQHQGVVAKVAAQAKHVTLDDVLDGLTEPPLLLVLDGITDPHNLGACLRVAQTLQKLLNDHLISCMAKNTIFKDICDRPQRILLIQCNENTLPRT